MNTKINFKSGLFTGSILGIIILVSGYFYFQNIMAKAEDIANIDLYQFEYIDLEGNEVSLLDYKGKHLLVNFWATWCGPCIKEFSVLNEAQHILKDDFVFVMVSDQSIDKIKAFVESKSYSFIYLKTNNNLLSNGITYIPQTFVFDKDGIKKQHHPTIFEGSSISIANTLQEWVKN